MPWPKGRPALPLKPESLQRIIDKNTGRKNPATAKRNRENNPVNYPGVREKISKSLTGRPLNPETGPKISKANKGKKKPDGFGQRQSERQTGVPHSESRKKNISIARTGQPNPRFAEYSRNNNPMKDPEIAKKNVKKRLSKNGGEYSDWRVEPRYEEWIVLVKSRDNYTCQHCGLTEGQLKTAQKLLGYKKLQGVHAHHIKPGERFPELRFVVDNGLTLCPCCHAIEEANAVSREIMAKLAEKLIFPVRPISFPIRPLTPTSPMTVAA